jgi:hypothetical protein
MCDLLRPLHLQWGLPHRALGEVGEDPVPECFLLWARTHQGANDDSSTVPVTGPQHI